MTARTARLEVVRGDDGHFARYLSSSDEVWRTSQVYTRRVGAERAVLSLARLFGIPANVQLVWASRPTTKVFMFTTVAYGVPGEVCCGPVVHYLDERTTP